MTMLRTQFAIVVLVLLLSPALFAQDFRFVSYLDYYGGIEPSEGYQNLRSRLYMAPEFSGYNANLGVEWLLAPRLWVEPMSAGEVSSRSIDPWDILFEGYIFLPLDNLEITLGQKVVAYGFADVMGPLNVVGGANRAPLSLDEYFDSRRPDALVQLTVYPSFVDSIELTWVPLSRPDREREGPVALPGAATQVLWSDDPYILDNPHSFFLNYSRFGDRLDLQLLYGWYTDATPDFTIGENEITPEYNRRQTLGGAWAARVGNGTLSQDIAFTLTGDLDGSDIGGKNSALTVNTQLLVNLPGGILSQYSLVYSWFPNHGGHPSGSFQDDPEATAYLAEEIQGFHLQPLEHIAFVVAHFERTFLREKLKAELNVGFFFSPEVYLAPRLSYSVSDNLMISAGADINLGDPPQEDLRRNPWNDNFYVRTIFRY